jgi:predicted phage tail protein
MVPSNTTTDLVSVSTLGLDIDTPIGIVEVSPDAAQPRVYRITNIVEAGQGRYTVYGSLHHEGKFAFFDDNEPVDYSPWTQLNPVTPIPTGLKGTPRSYMDEVTGPQHVIDVAWDAIDTTDEAGYRLLLQGYSLEVRRPGSGNWEQLYKGPNNFCVMRDAEPGEYVFSCRSINSLGKASPAMIAKVQFEYGTSDEIVFPPVFEGFD